MKRFEHTIQTPNGIHAAPARQIVKIARKYEDTRITVTVDGKTVQADAMMRLLTLGIRSGDRVTVT